jgi:hypothetical protein
MTTEESPTMFCAKVLGVIPYEWQLDAMESVAVGKQTSVVAANGSGKTARLIAPLILWFLHKHPRGQCVFTSGSWMQIQKQLWPAIRVFQTRFPKWQFMAEELRTPEGGFAFGFSTDNPGRAEGHHPKISQEEDPVFLIIDEAKTVPQSIFEAFDRCTRKYELWVSSPGSPRGPFFDSHHKSAGFFHTVKATSKDCLHIPAERYELDLRRYGMEHPLFRSKHLAEFTEDSGAFILTSERLKRSLESQPAAVTTGEVVAFCDFAAGGDENVLAVRKGNHAYIADAWHEKDTMQGVRQFIQLFGREELSAGQIWGDADGLGTVMIDALAEAGWRINRFHGGQAATERDEYANLIAEVWHVGAREIERGRVHLGQLDAKAFDQLTTRKSEWTDTGKLRVESKDKMRANGVKSPDRADALLGAIACGARMTGAVSSRDVLAGGANAFHGGFVSGW